MEEEVYDELLKTHDSDPNDPEVGCFVLGDFLMKNILVLLKKRLLKNISVLTKLLIILIILTHILLVTRILIK